MTARAEPVTRFQAHPADPTAFHAHLWPEPREREIGLPLVATALLVGVVFAAFLFVLPFVGLVLGAAVGVEMGPVR